MKKSEKLYVGLFVLIILIVISACQNKSSVSANSELRSLGASDKAVISFTFDDGRTTLYTNGLEILNNYNFPATVYVSTGLIDTDKYTFINWDKVEHLQSLGWEIASHTHNHLNLVELPNSDLVFELEKPLQVLGAIGSVSTSFAAPYGETNDNVLSEIKSRYSSARRSWKYEYEDSLNSFSNFDPYNLVPFELKHTTNASVVMKLIDRCVREKKYLILYAHSIVDTTSPSEYQYSKRSFNEIVSYVAELEKKNKLLVATVGDLVKSKQRRK